jgi:CRISPR-associated protein Cas2
MLVLVVYDIPDDKRRAKVATFLEGQGRRVQFSVFECFVSLADMKKLYKKVERLVEPAEDNVRFYWIASDCLVKALTIGSAPPEPPPSVYIL